MKSAVSRQKLLGFFSKSVAIPELSEASGVSKCKRFDLYFSL